MYYDDHQEKLKTGRLVYKCCTFCIVEIFYILFAVISAHPIYTKVTTPEHLNIDL